uniref:G_PROTEIN_RECEP_F1_2 domain-containing protein n=1 Tax=Angiostrongylus cantonensis TaxID=6313 RepID=A0A0K0DBP7_ANGCA
MLPAPVAGEYPPPPLVGTPFAQTAIPYSILFVVGTLGNTAVLAYVFFITRPFRSLKSSVTALGNTFVYIVALCAVDLLVTVSIPFSLSNTILNNWVFGEIGCKLHWAVELSNKVSEVFCLVLSSLLNSSSLDSQ